MRFGLAYSIKKLIEALPGDQFRVCASEAETLFFRLKKSSDACDFILHHYLVLALLADDFSRAQDIIAYLSRRSPRIYDQVLDFSRSDLGADFPWYESAYGLNDLPAGALQLVAPSQEAAQRSHLLIRDSLKILRASSAEAFSEIEGFRPLFVLASVSTLSKGTFGGYSSSIAWGSIALNVDRTTLASVLVQIIHEMAHQVLFALSAHIPLVYNHPQELYASPLRRDRRPMDGVVHACYVSARVYEVLKQIMAAPCFDSLAPVEQQVIMAALGDAAVAITSALPTIDESARLSGVGERVVDAARKVLAS